MIRHLFTYLLILNLPIQSFAGAAMMHCAPAQPHHQASAGSSIQMDHHQHHSRMKISEQMALPQIAKNTITQDDTPKGACACGTCQDCCCHGTATSPVSALFTVFALSVRSVSYVNNHFIPQLPPYRLDRPPRDILV